MAVENKQAVEILDTVAKSGQEPGAVIRRLKSLSVETPSWGYADTGTRFGKFLQAAAARTIEEKLDDAGQVNKLCGICQSVAVHVLWDFPKGFDAKLVQYAESRGVKIGAINPNLFQDQEYKWGSFGHNDPAVRRRALKHCYDSVDIMKATGSEYLSLWFADGTNYPGQNSIRERKGYFESCLKSLHNRLAPGQTMLVEYKPFEPAFYATDIADWGMACLHARKAGPRAKVLVDTGHHYLGQNVEQIVAFLIDEEMLGGFHFNDRHYADDDLTTGSIDPARIFRIFVEIVQAERERGRDLGIAYMIDQSHNIKPKVEAMIQTVTTVQELFAKALLVDVGRLEDRRAANDVVGAEECLRDAFARDVRGELASWRSARGLPADPLRAHRESGYEARAAADRLPRKKAAASSYA